MWEREKPAFPLYIFLYTLYSHMLQYRIAAPVAQERNLSCPIMGSQKEIHTYIIGLGLRPIWPMNESMG